MASVSLAAGSVSHLLLSYIPMDGYFHSWPVQTDWVKGKHAYAVERKRINLKQQEDSGYSWVHLMSIYAI